jgi:hypothetical protein
LHGFEDLLNTDRSLAGVNEIPGFDEKVFLEAAHGVYCPREVDGSDKRVRLQVCCRPLRG